MWRLARDAAFVGVIAHALGVLGVAPAHAEGRPCVLPEAGASNESPLNKASPEPATRASGGWLAGPGFGFGLGASGLGALACAGPNIARAALKAAVLAAESALGADAEIAIVLTTHPLGCGNIYYVPLANDVRGIGYQHADAREVFDDTPEHRLEGVAFLNDWPYWQPRLDELGSALNHEVGHRWGARVHALLDGVAPSALLGREQTHWSYFLDSGGSPLEGNLWRVTETGVASDTPRYPTQFSALDRYLMGVLPPAEVPPFQLFVDPISHGRDCAGRAAGPASPPQTCGSLELEATAAGVSIDAVIAAEGPRVPAAGAAPRQVGVLVLVLQSRDEVWGAADCRLMARSMRERIDAFERANAGRLRLENVLDGGRERVLEDSIGCDEMSRASSEWSTNEASSNAPSESALSANEGVLPAPARRSSCASTGRSMVGSSWGWVASFVALAIWRRASLSLG